MTGGLRSWMPDARGRRSEAEAGGRGVGDPEAALPGFELYGRRSEAEADVRGVRDFQKTDNPRGWPRWRIFRFARAGWTGRHPGGWVVVVVSQAAVRPDTANLLAVRGQMRIHRICRD